MSKPTEALSDVLYRASSLDFQRGYDRGWDDAYLEMNTEDWNSTPPFLRRFYWSPKDGYTPGTLRWVAQGEDEQCNRVISLRLWGGVLHIRWKRKLRWPADGECDTCRKEEEEWRNAS